MTSPVSAHRAVAVLLQELHKRYSSWSKVRQLHFPSIPRGTLCTIAKGGRIPRKHWKALGLIGTPKPLPEYMKWWRRLGKSERSEIIERLYCETKGK